MNRMSNGTLYVVAGPSGVGKGSVLSHVFATLDRLYYSVSITTRPPRQNEKHGINYLFCSKKETDALIASGGLLEYAEYAGNIYGTPSAPVEENLAQGRDVVLEIEVQGAAKVKAARPNAIMIFVAPPSFEELERRLRTRGTESDQSIARRLAAAKGEWGQSRTYDYIVVNSDIEQAADEIRAIILSGRCRTEKCLQMIENQLL